MSLIFIGYTNKKNSNEKNIVKFTYGYEKNKRE